MTGNDQPPPNLDIVSAPPLPNDEADVRFAKDEQRWYSREKRRVQLEGLMNDVAARKTWGERVFWLLVAWLAADFICVCADGFVWNGFHVSDTIVITLITTTTANVLGLGYVVAKYLFPTTKDDTP
jgi:hypothetical protein